MGIQKNKAINLILLGLSIQFIPTNLIGLYFKGLDRLSANSIAILYSIYLIAFLVGSVFLVIGCGLYIHSKGYNFKLGCLGLLSLLGSSILMLMPSRIPRFSIEEDLVDEPFKYFNIIELFLGTVYAPSIFFGTILVISCWLTGGDYLALFKEKSITIFYYFVSIVSLLILLKEYGLEGSKLNRVVGLKNKINLKVIAAIAIVEFGFAYGINSIILYNLSFVFPSYVESLINERSFTNIPEIIYMSIFVILLAPIFEELVFRGVVLQKWSTKWGVTTGVLASSMLFATFHFRYDIIPLFLTGIILSILYFKTSNILAPLLLHMFYNSMTIVSDVIYYLEESPIEREGLLTVQDLQNALQPLLAQSIFLVVTSAPFLFYFIWKNFPREKALIPYYANDDKDKGIV
jgi:uncharacterized protein